MSEAVANAATPAAAPGAPAAAAPRKPRSKLIVIGLVAVLALGGIGAGVYFMMGKKGGETAEGADEEHAEETPQLPPTYVKLDPPFVANFEARGATRFLQVAVEVMTRDAKVAELIKQHDPMIRNDLLMLFGSQTHETISKQEGKEQLRTKALEAVQNIISAQGGDGSKVEQLYFTSFVMQ